jgi:hypothetical protein
MTGHPVIAYYLVRSMLDERNREAAATRKLRNRFSG